jgi:hypothetical protein
MTEYATIVHVAVGDLDVRVTDACAAYLHHYFARTGSRDRIVVAE